MAFRDRFYIACLWTALWASLEVGKRAYEMGRRDGKGEAWREANQTVADFRAAYNVVPKGASWRERRFWTQVR